MRKQKSKDHPMTAKEVERLKSRPPKSKPPVDLLIPVHSQYLAFDKGSRPRVNTRLEKVHDRGKQSIWKFDVLSSGNRIESAKDRPPIEQRILPRKTLKDIKGELSLDPFLPDSMGFAPAPKRRRPPRRRPIRTRSGKPVEPLYIFSPDSRYNYFDLNYPWGCVGQVSCGGISSGVLIGPRHVLTASHSLDWNAPWAVFYLHRHGDYYTAVGHTWCVWYYEKLVNVNSENMDSDYVVCVLDQPLGAWYGYLGAKTYNDDWDLKHFWCHTGYAHDMGSAEQPTYQQYFGLEEEDGGSMKAMSSTTIDLTHAHSGGPVFGFWDGLPYVVGVVCGQAQSKNWIVGGSAMVNLILQARAETP